MKFFSSTFLPLLLLASPYMYGVHADAIRYNNSCLSFERRGSLDTVDELIFTHKPALHYDHILATPALLVRAKHDVIEIWRTFVVNAIAERITMLQNQASDVKGSTDLLNVAIERLQGELSYLQSTQYYKLESEELVAVSEQTIVLLMQWAKNITISGDEFVPVITVQLDDNTIITASSCCGDVPLVIRDHIYWQKLIEAGWVAVDIDALGRVQPILHPDVIGEKFHFYKTRFGVYFRETLGETENVPGNLLRIVTHIERDPRYNPNVQGELPVAWLKFPAEPTFDATVTGQYVPNENRAHTATWVLAKDLPTLYAEIYNVENN